MPAPVDGGSRVAGGGACPRVLEPPHERPRAMGSGAGIVVGDCLPHRLRRDHHAVASSRPIRGRSASIETSRVDYQCF
jgi:hypothetical protein